MGRSPPRNLRSVRFPGIGGRRERYCARATLDIDIMIDLGSLFRTKRAVEDLGFTLGAEPMDFHDGKVRIY